MEIWFSCKTRGDFVLCDFSAVDFFLRPWESYTENSLTVTRSNTHTSKSNNLIGNNNNNNLALVI